jgi:hypothetical protein
MKRNDIRAAAAPAENGAVISLPGGPEHGDGFLSKEDLLKRVPWSVGTLSNRLKQGCPHIKDGRRVLFHWPSVSDWLLRRQRGGVQ